MWIARFHGDKITKFSESEMANRKRHWELRNWGEEGFLIPEVEDSSWPAFPGVRFSPRARGWLCYVIKR